MKVIMSNVVAIDGPAASGKSTIANLVSKKLGIPYINTGNMYRAVTLHFLKSGVDIDTLTDEASSELLANVSLDYVKTAVGEFEIELNGQLPGDEIRAPRIAAKVSPVAALPSVRTFLTEKQREFSKLGLIVMEGRDIGTVVFPDAKHKFFLTATPLVRAQRRLGQDGETLDGSTVETVADEIAKRDELDMNRAVAPLKQADDATLVDTSDMNIEQVLEFIAAHVK